MIMTTLVLATCFTLGGCLLLLAGWMTDREDTKKRSLYFQHHWNEFIRYIEIIEWNRYTSQARGRILKPAPSQPRYGHDTYDKSNYPSWMTEPPHLLALHKFEESGERWDNQKKHK